MQKDEVLGNRQRADSKDETLLNDKLYLSQAKHFLKNGMAESALKCIHHALGNIYLKLFLLIMIIIDVLQKSIQQIRCKKG